MYWLTLTRLDLKSLDHVPELRHIIHLKIVGHLNFEITRLKNRYAIKDL